MVRDGFLLFYAKDPSAQEPAQGAFFDTRPKGILPLSGATVEKSFRGPPGEKWGLKVSQPRLMPGKRLFLATASEAEQLAWMEALLEGSRVTLENSATGAGFLQLTISF